MTLSTTCVDSSTSTITIISTLLDDFIASPSSYVDIDITGNLNNGDEITFTYDENTLIDDTTEVSTSGGVETINSTFFSSSSFSDGVYYFKIVLAVDGGDVETDEGCIFVNCSTTCSVDDYLASDSYTDVQKTWAAMIFSSLTSAGDCPCKCDKLATFYLKLDKLLENSCETC